MVGTLVQGQEVAVRWALGALVMRAAQRSSQAGQKNSSLLEHTRQQLQRLLAAGGWGDKHVLGQQVESVAPAKQLQSAKGHEDGEDSEEVAVVFTCGPEFCCATASIP